MKDSHIAKTIINQLGGLGRLQAMVGAKDFTWDNKTRTLSFKFSGAQNINCVQITLALDLYDLKFWKIPGTKAMLNGARPQVVEEVDMVGWEQLKEVFESRTGLLLSLR